MPRIVPSTITQFLREDAVLKNSIGTDPKAQPQLSFLHSAELSALLYLLDGLPEELLPRDTDNYMDFVVGMCAIQNAIDTWRGGDKSTILKPLKRWGGLGAVALIAKAMASAPDEAPAPTTRSLPFLPATSRSALQNDVAAVERAIHNGEWKAATVLAGSVIEALLVWALARDVPKAAACKTAPKGAFEKWTLADLISVAGELGLISAQTVKQADLARHYRNLIHPSVAERMKMIADRPTAFATFATMDLVTADLQRTSTP